LEITTALVSLAGTFYDVNLSVAKISYIDESKNI